MSLPQIVREDGRSRFLVDGQPFLILGLQWDCDSCFSAEEMNPLFPQAARLVANTAVLPVYWREVEPEPSQYEFQLVDERLRQARTNGLRVILLWFATWKNACSFYAPAYIRTDPATYPLAIDRAGQPTVSLCPSAETTWQRDRDALVALMSHLCEVDEAHTVIMIQIENEPGILGSERCYCPVCNDRFAAGTWDAAWGDDADEAFSAVSIARYIDRLAAETKRVYPLPVYANVWLGPPVGSLPGMTHPAGGAVPAMLERFRHQLHHLDFVAPDIYTAGYRDFRRVCQTYAAAGNPLYVAEHSSSPRDRAERNVFYAIGEHGAIGFDPWAIDSPFPEQEATPLVDPVGGEWGPQAFWLRDSYHAISRAVAPIVAAQGTDRLFTFVQEAAEKGTGWAARDCDLLVSYRDCDGAARGMLIQQAPSEFLLVGVGFDVRFRRRPDGGPLPVASAEWGRYNGDRWLGLHPMRRERPEAAGGPVSLPEPGVVRVLLDVER